MRRSAVIWWYELIPMLLVVNIAAVAPLNHPDSPQLDFLERIDEPNFNQWIWTTPAWYDGEFRPCTSGEQVNLVCAIAYGDAP